MTEERKNLCVWIYIFTVVLTINLMFSQVGGHTRLLLLDQGTICKPLNPRELDFYQNIPHDIEMFVPKYKGKCSFILTCNCMYVHVHVACIQHNYLCLTTTLTTTMFCDNCYQLSKQTTEIRVLTHFPICFLCMLVMTALLMHIVKLFFWSSIYLLELFGRYMKWDICYTNIQTIFF